MRYARYIIFSDGASTDETVATVFVTVQTDEIDPGVSSIKNWCVSVVKTQYVLKINSDVRITTNFLSGLVPILDNNPEASVVALKIIQRHEGKTLPEIQIMCPG